MTRNGQPIWSQCLCLTAGLCPETLLLAPELAGSCGPRPELTQDLALLALGRACTQCRLAPGEESPC